MRQERDIRINISEKGLKEIVCDWVREKKGLPILPSDVHFEIYAGDAGGYGSMGDPQHVYNSPTPASFGGCEIRYKEKLK